MIHSIQDKKQKEQIAIKILADLPEWFGLPESTAEYIENSKHMPFWADIEQGEVRGFLSLKETSKHTVEIYVMGILKEFHRHHIGRQLFQNACEYASQQGYTYLQVKTVKEGCYAEYDKTIKFYKSMGFKEFECFPTLWDEWNPCQIYIMHINLC